MNTGSTSKPSLLKLGRITVIALGLALLLAVLAAPLAVSLDWQVSWAPRALAQGTLIDDFTECAQEVTVSFTDPISTTTAIGCDTAKVLGGARTVKLERTGILPFAESKLAISFGFLQFSNEGSASSDATITWDANGAGLGSGSGIDLFLDPGINLTVFSSDLGVEVTVRLTDTDSNTKELTKTFGQTIAPGAPFFVDFDQLVGTADLTKISKIELVLIGGDSSDSILSLVEIVEPEVDFGDLPDGPNFPSFSYGTLLTNNGPRHIIDTNLLLGKDKTPGPNDATIDAEPDGQPSSSADGDDLAGLIPDDEQGIPAFPPLPDVDGNYPVTVDYVNTTGADATIVGWIDFDQSGSFEPDESATVIAPPTSVGGTSVVLPFVVPVEDRTGTTLDYYARVRIATDPAEIQEPTGLAEIGEVEDYRTPIEMPWLYDFGDLPQDNFFMYGTLLAQNGPRHIITSTLLLGKGQFAQIDAELDGQPSLDALGDDANGLIPDDEQGVLAFPLSPDAAGNYTVTVDYVNTTQETATIVGWIDFDRSGSFELDEEVQVTAPPTTVAGDSVDLPFVVPVEDRIPGVNDFYARFRIALDPAQIQVPTGEAETGEVEDYRTQIEIILAVSLGYFTAERDGDAVSFSWETATESGNAGFNLYMAVDDNLVLVNPEMIASSVIDSVAPVRYTYETQSAQAGTGEDFYIEIVNISGSSQRHGPFALGDKYGTAAASPNTPSTPGAMDYPLFLPVITGR